MKRVLYTPTPEEVKRMIEAAESDRDRMIIMILAYWGLREAELVGDIRRLRKSEKIDEKAVLRNIQEWEKIHGYKLDVFKDGKIRPVIPGLHVEDIDWERNCVTIYGKGWSTGRTAPEIHPVSKETLKILREYLLKHEIIRGKIFKLSTRTVRHIVKEIALKAVPRYGRYISPHRLRAFYITMLVDKYGIAKAREMARHSDISVTQIYYTVSEEEKRRMAEDVFSGLPKM